ncbi:MAG: hypothetical protein EOP09_17460 [Proteobacteria bacterium]|nr:MAG: hypothetical protein EOP09_17460 [Pseudomonadota bacterium]
MDGFSNPDTQMFYAEDWPGEPHLQLQSEEGGQCGGCSFFAPFNEDWGLCCSHASRHHLETVSEHFTCPSLAREGWGPHSFSNDPGYFCRCTDYTPLPPQTELICLQVRVEGEDGERVRAHLEVNDQFVVEDPSLYFALQGMQWQVEKALRQGVSDSA